MRVGMVQGHVSEFKGQTGESPKNTQTLLIKAKSNSTARRVFLNGMELHDVSVVAHPIGVDVPPGTVTITLLCDSIVEEVSNA